MSSPDLIEQIRSALASALQSQDVEVIDEDHLHAGHDVGDAHLAVKAKSPLFSKMAPLARHRAIMDACKPFFADGSLHALRVESAQPL